MSETLYNAAPRGRNEIVFVLLLVRVLDSPISYYEKEKRHLSRCDNLKLAMNPETIRSAIITAWGTVARPAGTETGLAYEAPEVERVIRESDYLAFAKQLRRFDKYYLFCYLTIDYACYLCGSYMLFGLSEWYEKATDQRDLSDPLAENLFYFLTGQRWPIEELRIHLSEEQICVVYSFLTLFADLVLTSGLLCMTRDRFPQALEAWCL